MNLKLGLESTLRTELNEKVICVGLEFQKFLTDLYFTTGGYEKFEDYPEEVFHDKLCNLLEKYGKEKLELPLLFSVELDEYMSMTGFSYRFTFLAIDKESFKQVCREYKLDKETKRKCFSKDTDFIVIYTGMSQQD